MLFRSWRVHGEIKGAPKPVTDEKQRYLPNKETPKPVAGCAHAVALTTALPAASASLPAASASLPAASSPVACGACRSSHSCQSSMASHSQGPCTRRPHTSPCGGRETPPDSDNRHASPICRTCAWSGPGNHVGKSHCMGTAASPATQPLPTRAALDPVSRHQDRQDIQCGVGFE